MAIDLFELIGQEYEFDTAVAELIDSGAIGSASLTINRETITADKTLTSADINVVQHLITTTVGLEVFLPLSPALNDHFFVVNSESSTEDLEINSVILAPGEIYEAIYDGVEWVEI